MKLQIALDEQGLEDGIALCRKVRAYINIIEIGTPLLMREGVRAVRMFRQAFPEKEILADAKIMDAGEMEAAICFEAGADYVTVLGVTDLSTIRACVNAAALYGKRAVADMICVSDLEERVRQIEEAGIRNITVHTGVDQQRSGLTPLKALMRIRKCFVHSEISVAGGLCPDTIGQYIRAGADIVITGGAIARAKDPAEEAKAFATKIQKAGCVRRRNTDEFDQATN